VRSLSAVKLAFQSISGLWLKSMSETIGAFVDKSPDAKNENENEKEGVNGETISNIHFLVNIQACNVADHKSFLNFPSPHRDHTK
jgi:hypothetical protein